MLRVTCRGSVCVCVYENVALFFPPSSSSSRRLRVEEGDGGRGERGRCYVRINGPILKKKGRTGRALLVLGTYLHVVVRVYCVFCIVHSISTSRAAHAHTHARTNKQTNANTHIKYIARTRWENNIRCRGRFILTKEAGRSTTTTNPQRRQLGKDPKG